MRSTLTTLWMLSQIASRCGVFWLLAMATTPCPCASAQDVAKTTAKTTTNGTTKTTTNGTETAPVAPVQNEVTWEARRRGLDRETDLVPQRQQTDGDRDRVRAATMVLQARILQRQGDLPRALQLYQRAYRWDPNAKAVLHEVVSLALELGRVGEATRYALLLANTDFDDPFLAERLAMLLADQLEYDRSLQLYQRVLQLHDDDNEQRNLVLMHFEMGRLYFLVGKHQQAANSFRLVVEALASPADYDVSDSVRSAMLAKPEVTYSIFGEAFLEAGDLDLAADMFRKAAELGDKADWLELQLARVDFKAQRFESARERLEAYIRQKLHSGGKTPYQLLQQMMTQGEEGAAAQQQLKDAVLRFRDWLADDPDNFPLMSFVADLTRRSGGWQDAARLYEASLEREPTLEAYRGLVATYTSMRDADRLLTVLEKFVSDLHDLSPLSREVQEIVQIPDLKKRLFVVGRQRLGANPESGRSVAAACGLLAIEAGEFQIADEFFERIGQPPAEVDPRETVRQVAADLCLTWGTELVMADQHARAESVFQFAVDNKIGGEENRAVFLFYLAGAQQLNGKTDLALETAQAAAALRPHVPAFAMRPAWILYHADRMDAAKQAYLTWLQEFGDNHTLPGVRDQVRDARFVLSTICAQRHEIDEASETLEKILDEFPEDVGAMNDLGYLWAEHGRSLERACRMVRRAVEIDPENGAYHDSLGWVLYRLGQYEEALTHLEIAAKFEPQDPLVLEHLGDAQLRLDRTAAAIDAWRRALGLLDTIDLTNSALTSERRVVIESKIRAHEGQ